MDSLQLVFRTNVLQPVRALGADSSLEVGGIQQLLAGSAAETGTCRSI
jgi:hypothetical protein